MSSRNKRRREGRAEQLLRRSNVSSHTLTQQQVVKQFSGPLPPPEVLAKFEQIEPGLANRIVTMAEGEATHRRQLESKVVDQQEVNCNAGFTEARVGQVFALIIGLVAICAGAYCGTHGAEMTGSFIGAGGVIGLVTAFLIGRAKIAKPPEDNEKK